jgi:hypothetical protein
VSEPGSEWGVWVGGGLLANAPMSPERREQQRREDEKEAREAEQAAQLSRERALEHAWELQRQGVEAHTHADVLARQAFGEARADRREEKIVAAGYEAQGRPAPRLNQVRGQGVGGCA